MSTTEKIIEEKIVREPVRERVTWVRWSKREMRNVRSHPFMWLVTEPDGYLRYFDTKREAVAWIADFNAEIDYVNAG